jgi:hypothetical protein
MQLRPIIWKKQPIHEDTMKEALFTCYENIAFSTFPYIRYNLTSSERTLTLYNSGNCIALSMFIKRFLKVNYNVDAYIVPSTVPSIFRVEGTPDVCHVALLVPITPTTFYIVDPAFYFLEPMHLHDHKHHTIDSMNIHTQTHTPIHYILEENQVRCYFTKEDPWFYHTQEVTDPDTSIGCHFIRQKPQPFLCKTIMVNKEVYKKYHIKEENDTFIVIKDHVEIYAGPKNQMPKSLKHELRIYLYKYFKT